MTSRSTQHSRRPLTALVVDDTAPVRRTIAQALKFDGHAADEADSFLEAEALLDRVDAVVTDGSFPYRPGADPGPWGLVLAQRTRALDKVVILLSGNSRLVVQACEAGMVAMEKL